MKALKQFVTNSGPGYIVYRRYTIGTTRGGEVYITRDGVTIMHDAGSIDAAKQIVDSLS